MSALEIARCENCKLATRLRLADRYLVHAHSLPQTASNDDFDWTAA